MNIYQEFSNNILSEISLVLQAVKEEQVKNLIQSIVDAKRVFFVGAGRSCLILNAFCMRLNHLGFESYVAGNIPCPPVKQGDLLITMTGSGTTPSVLSIVKHAKSFGPKICAITTCPDTEIEKISETTLYIPAPTKVPQNSNATSNQLMGTLFEQTASILFDTIIMILSKDITNQSIIARHTNLE